MMAFWEQVFFNIYDKLNINEVKTVKKDLSILLGKLSKDMNRELTNENCQ